MENHKITIKNLGPIKELIDFEIKKFNLLIGKSAAGKSVLAKAVFLFNYAFSGWEYSPVYLSTLPKAQDYIRKLLEDFFPQYRSYKIQYQYAEDLAVSVTRNGDKISVKFSPELVSRRQKVVQHIKKYKKSNVLLQVFLGAEAAGIRNDLIKNLGLFKTIFIPAARGVVADFNRGRLKLLNSPWLSADDPFEKETNLFSQISEGDVTLKLFSGYNMESVENFQKLSEEYEEIAKGKVYKHYGERIVLTTMDGKQTLTMDQWSSGQKEVIPILILLQYIAEKNIQTFLIIEEPEAHLFPEDQTALLDKIATVAKATRSKVFITTHNPILLMATNNLIEAEKREYKDLEARSLRHSDMQACKLENGKCESIMDEKVNLTDGNYIENEKRKIMDEFDKIVDSKL